MITKSEELAVLDKAIKQLGPDSYLGPWLLQVRGELEQTIRSDYFPAITLAAAQDHVKIVLENARNDARAVVSQAKQEAAKINQDARQTHDRLAGQVRDALRALERW